MQFAQKGKNMNKKSLLMTSLIATIGYIVYLKVVGLNTIDYTDLFNSIKPLILHALALLGTFAFNLAAYLKGRKMTIVWTAVLAALAAISYIPMSMVMLIPLGILMFAYTKA
jgi:hypothetical protein